MTINIKTELQSNYRDLCLKSMFALSKGKLMVKDIGPGGTY